MDDRVKQLLKNPIQLSDQLIKAADEARYCKQECGELKSTTEKLAALLRQAERESSSFHERPTQRIMQETEQVLCKALWLVKFRAKALLKLLVPITRAAAFRKVSFRLHDSVGNVSWLLGIFNVTHARDGNYLDLVKPSIVVKESILCRKWEQIAILHTGLPKDWSAAAATLVSLASNGNRNWKLIIEEGGVSPLLKLLKEGNTKGQENAARAVGLLGRDPESVEHMIDAGVFSVFAKILMKGTMIVQSVVAWAVSKLAESYPKCQDLFSQHNITKLLVEHLTFLTVEKRGKYPIVSLKRNSNSEDEMKEMATLALWLLAKGNSPICRSLAESRALLCFAVLLETGSMSVRHNCAMAVMEITAVAEKDADLRESAFNSSSPAFKAILNQVLRLIEKENSLLLIPCIKTIGYLARAATETRMIGPLVRLLHMRDTAIEVHMEALIALAKYACTDNDLHMDHSMAIISAGGVEHLISLVYLLLREVQIPAFVLLSYIALHWPLDEKHAQFNVLEVLEWASKDSYMTRDEFVMELLRESKSRLELSSKFS